MNPIADGAPGSSQDAASSISVCTTTYNVADSVTEHVHSVYRSLSGFNFEYIVVDNKSRDGTTEILREFARTLPRFLVEVRRCSRGLGRELAVERASHETILCVDADTIYDDRLRGFTRIYLNEFRPKGITVQAIHAGLYPRDVWQRAGGMRDLNYAEDLDLWLRIWKDHRMRWTPVVLGDNRKPVSERNWDDPLSSRYPPQGRLARILRREVDMWRVRKYYALDLEAIRKADEVDLGLGSFEERWFGPAEQWSFLQATRRVKAGFTSLLRRSR